MRQLTLEEKYDIIEEQAYKYMGYNSGLWKTILQFNDFKQVLSGSLFGYIKHITHGDLRMECMVRRIGEITLKLYTRNFEILYEETVAIENRVYAYEKWMELMLEYFPEEIEKEYDQALRFINMNGICAVIPGDTKEEIVNNLKELLKDFESGPIICRWLRM